MTQSSNFLFYLYFKLESWLIFNNSKLGINRRCSCIQLITPLYSACFILLLLISEIPLYCVFCGDVHVRHTNSAGRLLLHSFDMYAKNEFNSTASCLHEYIFTPFPKKQILRF